MHRPITAVLLAAGLGVRLRPLTECRPKGLVPVGGRPLLAWSLDALSDRGFEEAILVTGHLGPLIRETFGERHGRMRIRTVESPEYGTTGSLRSLYEAREAIGGRAIALLESDLLYDPAALDRLIAAESPDTLLASSPRGTGDEVWLCADGRGRLTDLGKTLSAEKRASAIGELVGISKFSPAFLEAVFRGQERAAAAGRDRLHYEEMVAEQAAAGRAVQVLPLPGLAWTEVDTPADLALAEGGVLPKIIGGLARARAGAGRIRRNVLLNPGPATTTETVKWAQVAPDLCPREEEFKALMDQLRRDIVSVVVPGAPPDPADGYVAVLLAGSGTAGIDACVNSALPRDGKLLVLENGAYGRRIAEIAAAYGIAHQVIHRSGAESFDPAEVAAVLAGDPAFRAVAMIHHETSSGILNPVAEIARIAHGRGCTLILDAISSYAGVPIDARVEGIDFLVSTSNKCIQGLPGLCFVVARRAALEATRDFPVRSYYLNLYRQHRYFEDQREMRFTPPVQVIFALRQAFREYFAEGGARRWERYQRSWRVLVDGMTRLGFGMPVPVERGSRILTTFFDPVHPNFSFMEFHDRLYARGFTIYPGKVSEWRSFRLANMGDLDEGDLLAFLDALEATLAEMNVPIPVGGE